MKKILYAFLVLFVLLCAACLEEDVVGPGSDASASSSSGGFSSSSSSSPTTTRLTIASQVSSGEIDLVYWYDADNDKWYFGEDAVWDYILEQYVPGFKPGSSHTREVDPGSSAVYFYFTVSATRYRTVETVALAAGQQKTFTFQDTTQIVSMGRPLGEAITVRQLLEKHKPPLMK